MAKADFLRLARKSLPFLIFLAGMLPVLYQIGTAGLFETSEGRYASVARNMLDSGDWFTPRHNGLKHFTKPPVTYWLAAAGMKLFGINEFGARFFLSFAAGLTAVGTYLIGKLLYCKFTGLLASIILISSIFFQVQFRGLTTDPFLTAAETFMVLGFLSFVRKRRFHWEIFFWICAAFAMLTKGPPGLLPLAGLIPAALLTGHAKEVKMLFKSIAGWIIFVILGLGWYLLIALTNPGLFSYFIIDETIKRVASSEHKRSAPFYYFLFLLPAGLFPWSTFFLASLKGLIGKFRHDTNITFLLMWLAVPLMIFSLSRSKLAGYALPLMVPLALLTAYAVRDFLARNLDEIKQRSWQRHGIAVSSIVAVSAIGMLIWSFNCFDRNSRIALIAFFTGFGWLFTSGFIVFYLIRGNVKPAFAWICMLVPVLMFFLLPGLRGNEKIGDNKYLTSQWMLLKRIATLPESQNVICLEQMIEGWYFYTGRTVKTWNVERITKFDNDKANQLVLQGDAALLKEADRDCILVVREKSLERITKALGRDLNIITREGNWVVAMPTGKSGP